MQARAATLALAAGLLAMPAGVVVAHEGHEHHATDAAAAVSSAAPARSSGTRWGADYFPNVSVVDQDGRALRFFDDLLKDKVVAVNVIYTRCDDECPLETASLARVQHILGGRVGRDIHFISISIDPTHDAPEVLRAYAEKFHVGPGWSFVTGQPEDIALVVRKLGLSRDADRQNRDGHTASLMIGDVPHGQWLRESSTDNPEFLVAKIGTFVGKWPELMPKRSYAEVQRPLGLSHGEALFNSNCVTCHSIGEGAKVGPDLLGVTTRRDRSWLERYILMPDRVRAGGDAFAAELALKYPQVRMPNLNLGGGDVAAVLGYIEARSAGRTTTADGASAVER